jgi:hypothetical protein
VLAWLPFSGDWQLALIRTGNTIAGALISLLAMAFSVPHLRARPRPQFLRASLDADRRYLAQLRASWRTRSRSSRLLANARRAAGLAHNDTEESLERLLAESWPRRRPFAQFVAAFVTYLRRFAQSVTTLTALDGEWEWKLSDPIQNRLALLDVRLQWLEEQTGLQPTSAQWPGTIPARSRNPTCRASRRAPTRTPRTPGGSSASPAPNPPPTAGFQDRQAPNRLPPPILVWDFRFRDEKLPDLNLRPRTGKTRIPSPFCDQ